MELLTPTAEITPLQRAQARLVHNTTHSEQTQSILLSPVRRFSTREIKLILCSQCWSQFTGSINAFRVTWDEITSSGFAAAANHTQWHFKVVCFHRDARNSPYAFALPSFVRTIDRNSILRWSRPCSPWWIAVSVWKQKRRGVVCYGPVLQSFWVWSNISGLTNDILWNLILTIPLMLLGINCI